MERVPGPHRHTKFHCSRIKYVGLQPQKLQENLNFSYKFAPKGKFCRSTEKVEYRSTTTNLPVCNDTIMVLKITLLHSISVITNFVIPKRDKQELSYCKQITRKLCTQYVEGIHRPKYYTVTLKSRLRVTQGYWKRNS